MSAADEQKHNDSLSMESEECGQTLDAEAVILEG